MYLTCFCTDVEAWLFGLSHRQLELSVEKLARKNRSTAENVEFSLLRCAVKGKTTSCSLFWRPTPG